MNNKFYSKNERELLLVLSAGLGTNHRGKPYDFNDMNDLREYAVLLISSYMDYRKDWIKRYRIVIKMLKMQEKVNFILTQTEFCSKINTRS